ncbi:MAG: hypothetical protein GZ090_01500 [Oxalobacteraceae bacterium]|nr:hypothetical protein [Oxalobacteraceae bacterium]
MRKTVKTISQRLAWLPRFRLVQNWRSLHRSYTVNISVVLALLSAAQDQWPLFQSFINPQRFAGIALVLALAIVVMRYVEQKSIHAASDASDGGTKP